MMRLCQLRSKQLPVLLAAFLSLVPRAIASDLRVLTAGALKETIVAMTSELERATGQHIVVESDTAGALTKRIEAGEKFDVVIVTAAEEEELIRQGKVLAESAIAIGGVGIGVCVKEGSPKPDIGSVDAFRRTLLAAKSVGYMDPAGGASSGIYVENLLERLGIRNEVHEKAKLKRGGRIADLVESGEAEIGIQQTSEIIPVAGVTFVGPLPDAIQNVTLYSGGVGSSSTHAAAAMKLLRSLRDPRAIQIFRDGGVTPAK